MATRSSSRKLADQARVQADASSALREELDRLAGDYNFALATEIAFPAALQVVEDVTKLLPDDTWLTQFELKTTARGKEPRRELVLRGESANAGSLISLLEESKVFEQAAPRSPTTKIQPGPGEIFDLGAQLKSLPLPRPIQLAADGRRCSEHTGAGADAVRHAGRRIDVGALPERRTSRPRHRRQRVRRPTVPRPTLRRPLSGAQRSGAQRSGAQRSGAQRPAPAPAPARRRRRHPSRTLRTRRR